MNRSIGPLFAAICLTMFIGATLAACGGGAADASGSSESDAGGLRASDVRPALAELPYKISLKAVQPPPHDDAAFRGVAVGPLHTRVEFSIGIGPQALAVPIRGIGTMHAVSNGAAGFAFNDTTSGGGDFKTVAQWNEAVRMVVDMEEKLCRRATGQACPA